MLPAHHRDLLDVFDPANETGAIAAARYFTIESNGAPNVQDGSVVELEGLALHGDGPAYDPLVQHVLRHEKTALLRGPGVSGRRILFCHTAACVDILLLKLTFQRDLKRGNMPGKNVHSANDISFDKDVLQSDVPVVVDFTATWCGPCKALAPILDQFADENAGVVKVVKVDTDESPGSAVKYGVRGVPTIIVFKGGNQVGRHTGVLQKAALTDFVKRSTTA